MWYVITLNTDWTILPGNGGGGPCGLHPGGGGPPGGPEPGGPGGGGGIPTAKEFTSIYYNTISNLITWKLSSIKKYPTATGQHQWFNDSMRLLAQ